MSDDALAKEAQAVLDKVIADFAYAASGFFRRSHSSAKLAELVESCVERLRAARELRVVATAYKNCKKAKIAKRNHECGYCDNTIEVGHAYRDYRGCKLCRACYPEVTECSCGVCQELMA